MFLGRSGMVSQTPIYISDPVGGDSFETLKNVSGLTKRLSITSNKHREEENVKISSDVNPWSDVVTRNLIQSDTETNKSNTEKDGWIMVPAKSKKNASVKSWRPRLDILRGTATSETEGESLSSDIHLVAFGVKKNVTGLELSHWLTGKGLQVLSCDLLTKYEAARSLVYRITIKSCDYKKNWIQSCGQAELV